LPADSSEKGRLLNEKVKDISHNSADSLSFLRIWQALSFEKPTP